MKIENLNKLEKDLKAKKVKSILNVLRRVDFNAFLKDFIIDPNEGFKEVLKLYEKIEPSWVDIHNSLEEKKPERIRTFLDTDTKMQDIIEETDGDELAEFALAVIGSNRIAHAAMDSMEFILKLMNDRNHSSVEVSQAYTLLKNYFQTSKDDEKKLSRRKEQLQLAGINITEKEEKTFELLVNAQTFYFNIKDQALFSMLTTIKEKNMDINYGLINDDEGKELFVMDLPFYGQFSVHTKKPRFEKSLTDYGIGEYKAENKDKTEDVQDINEVRKKIGELLQNKPYREELFERENLILTSNMSTEAEAFSKSLRNLKNDEERIAKIDEVGKRDPRYGHYLKVKNGYNTRGRYDGKGI